MPRAQVTANVKRNHNKMLSHCLMCPNRIYRHYSFCSLKCFNEWRIEMGLAIIEPHAALVGIKDLGISTYNNTADTEGIPEQKAAYATMLDPQTLKAEYIKWQESLKHKEALNV